MHIPEDGILACIGNTPLVRLTKALGPCCHLYAKLEGMNPGGSIKDRPALEILRHAIDIGAVSEHSVIVEATSGNMGVALAMVCRRLGLRLICVVDNKATVQSLRLMELYGAEIELVTEPDPITGDLLQARINRAQALAASTPGSFWVNQYANEYAARAHYRTMDEIMIALDGQADYLFCGASSCGTIRGCADYLRSRQLERPRLWAVDAEGSVIFGGRRASRAIPGHGAGIRPALYRDGMAARTIAVSDAACVAGCRHLLATEGLLVGGSSGGVFSAVQQVYDELPRGATCVMLLPDRGERYLSTIFSDTWVEAQFGTAPLLASEARVLASRA